MMLQRQSILQSIVLSRIISSKRRLCWSFYECFSYWLKICLVLPFLLSIVFPFASGISCSSSSIANGNATNKDASSLSNIADRPPAYLSWLQEFGNNYENLKYFGSNDQIALHWNITNERLFIAVVLVVDASYSDAVGWLGFGLTEAGGMAGADMVLFTTRDKKLVDAYSEDYTVPTSDKCQDWYLHRSMVCPAEIILFEASRKLVTGDTQDLSITYDGDSSFSPTRIIFAHGNTPTVLYHGPNNVAFGEVRFYGSSPNNNNEQKHNNSHKSTNEDDVHAIELTTRDFQVPLNETIYQRFCFYISDLLPKGSAKHQQNSAVHAVAMQYISDDRSKKFVHHMILYGSHKENDCESAISPFYVWAPGSDDFVLPENVGVLLGGKRGFKSFRLSVHFSNPNGIEGIIDNSGVRLMYTRVKRQYNAGMIGLGDPGITLDGQLLGEGFTQWKFECPSSCTEKHLGGEESTNITVFAQLLHMHSAGKRMSASQIRDGRVIRKAYVDYYDYRAAGAVAVRQPIVPYEISPGDSFDIRCFFEDPTNTIIFGKSFRDEMCISFIWYYPEIRSFLGTCGANISHDPSCDGQFSSTSLPNKNALGRIFGSEAKSCSAKSKGAESETILS